MFDFGGLVNDISSSNIFDNILTNPFFSTILITLAVLFIIYWVFSDAVDADEMPFWRLWLRSGIYIGIVVLVTTFLHYARVVNSFEQRYEEKLLSATVNSTTGGNIPPPIIPVVPVTPAPEQKTP